MGETLGFMQNIAGSVFSPSNISIFSTFSTIILLAVCAAFISKRTGVLNIAIDGIIVLVYTITYVLIAYFTQLNGEQTWISILGASLIGIVSGLIVTVVSSCFIVKLKYNDVFTGLIFNVFARNISIFIFAIWGAALSSQASSAASKLLETTAETTFLQAVLENMNITIIIALIMPMICYFIMNKTHYGLSLRATEENPAALIGSGVDIRDVKLKGLAIAGGIASLAGVALAVSSTNITIKAFEPKGFGYVALVLVFAAGGRLWKSCGYAIIFSLLFTIPQVVGANMTQVFSLQILVYIATLMLMLIHSIKSKRRFKKKVDFQIKANELNAIKEKMSRKRKKSQEETEMKKDESSKEDIEFI